MMIVAVLVLIDMISKSWVVETHINETIIPGVLNFTYVENRGMVFGFAQGTSYVMGFVSLIICALIIAYIYLSKCRDDNYSFGWNMVLAGGISNMIDRFSRGYVVDFIDTPWIATFNLADIFIVLGIFVLIVDAIINRNKER